MTTKPEPSEPQSKSPGLMNLFPRWVNPLWSIRHPIQATQEGAEAGKEATKRFAKDVWFNLASFPAATVQGLQTSEKEFRAYSAFERHLSNRLFTTYFVMFCLSLLVAYATWKAGDGGPLTNVVGTLPILVVGTLWFLRGRGFDPVKSWLRANMEQVDPSAPGTPKSNVSPTLVREMTAIRLNEIHQALSRWKNLKPQERTDASVVLASQILGVLSHPFELAESLPLEEVSGVPAPSDGAVEGDGPTHPEV